jgi:hypothetical protein
MEYVILYLLIGVLIMKALAVYDGGTTYIWEYAISAIMWPLMVIMWRILRCVVND